MQALLIYKLDNKNHLKSINDQNFSHFMRGYDKGGYDKGFYGICWHGSNKTKMYLLYFPKFLQFTHLKPYFHICD